MASLHVVKLIVMVNIFKEAMLPNFMFEAQQKPQIPINQPSFTLISQSQNDSLKPILSDTNQDMEIQIGFIRSFQMFIIDSSLLFSNRFYLQRERINDTCILALNIYKRLIRIVQMDQNTWYF